MQAIVLLAVLQVRGHRLFLWLCVLCNPTGQILPDLVLDLFNLIVTFVIALWPALQEKKEAERAAVVSVLGTPLAKGDALP